MFRERSSSTGPGLKRCASLWIRRFASSGRRRSGIAVLRHWTSRHRKRPLDSYGMRKGEFIVWYPGCTGSRILVDAVHAAPPRADVYTGPLARAAAKKLGGHCIVATVSRTRADLNRRRGPSNAKAIDEYRTAIRSLLSDAELLVHNQLNQPVLHLAVHGMTDAHGYDVEIGTRNGVSCSARVRDLVKSRLESWARGVGAQGSRVVLDGHFVGDASKAVHRCGEASSKYLGYGPNFNTVQIEFAHWLRRNYRDEVIAALVAVGTAFESLD